MDYLRKYWYIVCITLIGIGYILVSAFKEPLPTEVGTDLWDEAMLDSNLDSDSKDKENEQEEKQVSFFVDIKGEVVSPGVYELENSTRVIEAIETAGGFTDLAERRGVNLAEKIFDEMVIYVPKKGEEEGNWARLQSEFNPKTKKVNINLALASELETLPGIGPSKANAIISYRQENGPFQSIEELEKVTGIGKKSLELLREYIQVE